jgi:hypothetical protein
MVTVACSRFVSAMNAYQDSINEESPERLCVRKSFFRLVIALCIKWLLINEIAVGIDRFMHC